MRYVIVKGGKSSGKATTINEVCRRLAPEKVTKVIHDENGSTRLSPVSSLEDLTDGNYIIRVKNKNILVVSGAPTQQKQSITTIIESVQKLEFEPEFALVAMSGLEKFKNFKTAEELQKFGKCIHETKIWRIPSHNFINTDEWKKRIAYLTAITLHNI
ncbi:hypothetical protein AM493_00255 [Flavobacterium akiainvivens]|uniref:Uncharacterized protein n=1 Tax=Flavobacterium akiainvivens TaxID=1202724 RepID=A0A0M8MAI8_9FLAO|nr:hypothetical protein [Flavobacterium akiainvivens]KOS04644.1 hypothetical protein AM493_00255 [Flavobacterium akiainvivens]SFQ65492.1 hypothetical protein SAMN05444144_11271 [Flavobacterium akiainvivens]